MATTTGNDSGVDTSNDSNDTSNHGVNVVVGTVPARGGDNNCTCFHALTQLAHKLLKIDGADLGSSTASTSTASQAGASSQTPAGTSTSSSCTCNQTPRVSISITGSSAFGSNSNSSGSGSSSSAASLAPHLYYPKVTVQRGNSPMYAHQANPSGLGIITRASVPGVYILSGSSSATNSSPKVSNAIQPYGSPYPARAKPASVFLIPSTSASAKANAAAAAAAAASSSSSSASSSTPTAAASASAPSSSSSSSASPSEVVSLNVPVSFLTTFTPKYPSEVDKPHNSKKEARDATRRRILKGNVYRHLTTFSTDRKPMPYIQNLSGERKLRLAASLSNTEVLVRLLDGGVNPNSTDEYQRSALHLAASRGYTDVVIQLLKYGARPNAKDSLGNTPLHLAVCSASSFNFNRVVRILLKNGASVKVEDKMGKTPLDLVKSKLSLMRSRISCSPTPEGMKMLFDLSVLTALLINIRVQELKANDEDDGMTLLESRLQQLSTTEVETEADALLAKVEQLTLKN